MAMYKFRVDGLKEFAARLQSLKPAAQEAKFKAAIRAGGKVIEKAARSMAPTETGLLRKSLGVVVRTYPSSGTLVAVIGPRRGFADTIVRGPRGSGMVQYRDPAMYGHLVEGGTTSHDVPTKRISGEWGQRIIRQTWTMPGTKAQGFLGPAFEQNKQAAMNKMALSLRKVLMRLMRKK